jgi:hypothetical protein
MVTVTIQPKTIEFASNIYDDENILYMLMTIRMKRKVINENDRILRIYIKVNG